MGTLPFPCLFFLKNAERWEDYIYLKLGDPSGLSIANNMWWRFSLLRSLTHFLLCVRQTTRSYRIPGR